MFEAHRMAKRISLPREDFLPYWGSWYANPPSLEAFNIDIQDDYAVRDVSEGSVRDVYHYEHAVSQYPSVSSMLVANTGFQKHISRDVPKGEQVLGACCRIPLLKTNEKTEGLML